MARAFKIAGAMGHMTDSAIPRALASPGAGGKMMSSCCGMSPHLVMAYWLKFHTPLPGPVWSLVLRPNGELLYSPHADVILEPDAVLIALGQRRNLDRLEKLAGPDEKR